MENKLKDFLNQAITEISQSKSLEELEGLRIKFLGRKSLLSQVSQEMGKIPKEDKPKIGRLLNEIKTKLTIALDEKIKTFSQSEEKIDLTLRKEPYSLGEKHPLNIVISEICSAFEAIGFEVQEGTEVETEEYNFQALNIPMEHPSRDAFDTFYLNLPENNKGYKYLLRSHTSPAQIRIMEKRKPPLAVIVPGKVYRPDSVDASHSFMFHQIEGFAVDKNISFSDLKGVLLAFVQKVFSKDTKLRFRPHFFPFTEPSAEVDISCIFCKGKGCSVCKNSGWLEILGCGMIHPKVLEYTNINPAVFRGFAFGMGVERITMLKYGIDDIRTFFFNHKRFLEQFYEI